MRFSLLLLTALAALGQKPSLESVPNPAAAGSIQPNWSTTPDGGAVLSWVEPEKNGAYTLRYAVRQGAQWSEPRTVVSGRRFFRHPAEVPEVLQWNAHQWLARWIEQPDAASEAEFVYLSSSTDGARWSVPVMAHKDRSPVEHGLASMVPSGANEVSVIWLETPMGEDGPAYLMRTVADRSGKELKEERLDPDVCTCCPTAVTRTAKGLLVAYRGHTPEDIRDISVIRFQDGKWSQPKNVHADKWKVNACPINAASVAAKGDHVALAWFTGAQDNPRVQVAFSEDGGATFGNAALASMGRAFGYASVVLGDDGGATVSWLEQAGSGDTNVVVRKISTNGAAGPAIQVATGGRQALGYPRLIHSAAGTFIAWGGNKIQTARLP
jgi:hypothetical protein